MRKSIDTCNFISIGCHEGTLRKISGPKRDEQTGELRKLHNVQLHNLYGNADIIRTLKLRGWGMLHGWEMEEEHTRVF